LTYLLEAVWDFLGIWILVFGISTNELSPPQHTQKIRWPKTSADYVTCLFHVIYSSWWLFVSLDKSQPESENIDRDLRLQKAPQKWAFSSHSTFLTGASIDAWHW
jgi:hypothetical protein